MPTPPIPSIDWLAIGPVLSVTLAGILALLVEMFRPKRSNDALVLISVLGLGLAIVLAVPQLSMTSATSFGGMVHRDSLGAAFQIILAGSCLLCVVFSEAYLRQKRAAFGEFYPLALWSTAGGMIMASTTNLLMVFLGLEVLSIALYCLVGICRNEHRSEEGAIKYFLLGSFASAFLLFGMALVFGATGSLDLGAIGTPITDDATVRVFHLLGFGLMLVGLAFKAAFVPFHQWAPDVYQGAPTNVTAFMATVSKAASFAVLVRLLESARPLQSAWFEVVVVVAVITMTVGNLTALGQRDVKRALGLSSVAHSGYMLVALLAHVKDPARVGTASLVFYTAAYAAMTIGAFAVVGLVAKDGKESTRMQDFHGFWQRSPFAAGCMVLFMASMVGIPPTGGFFGKLFIFQDALSTGLNWLAVVLAVNSAISAFYYLGIVQSTFVSDEGHLKNRASKPSPTVALALVACAALTFALSFWAEPARGTVKWLESTPVAMKGKAD